MSTVGQIEKKTQARVVKLFREQLGYDYLRDWTDRREELAHYSIALPPLQFLWETDHWPKSPAAALPTRH